VHAEFAKLTESLMPMCEALGAMPSVRGIPGKEKIKGVYLFSEEGRHLYIGRSNDIRRRYKQHFSPGSRINDAPFAVLLAREATGISRVYSGEYVRKKLALNETFVAAFSEAKARISRMEFRFVQEHDPIRQTLLEVYCAVVLATPYNKFEVS
jgi:GIY-YIG catalytic domain